MEFDKLPDVAKSVYYPCNKCDRERYFKVITHLSPTEAKIECEVCKSKRKLKIGKKATKKRTTRTKKSVANHQAVFGELQEKFSSKEAQPYGINKSFANESVIDHPTFGVGYVTTALTNKIEVVFEEGVKTLVHKKS